MRQDAAVKGVEWIGVGAIIIGMQMNKKELLITQTLYYFFPVAGLIFIIAGAIVSGIAYTEITPPNYDVK